MPPAAAADYDNNSDDDGIAVGGIGSAEVRNMAEESFVLAEDEDEQEEMCRMDDSVDLLEQALVVVGMLPSHPFESGLPKLSYVRMFAFCSFWYC